MLPKKFEGFVNQRDVEWLRREVGVGLADLLAGRTAALDVDDIKREARRRWNSRQKRS